jgi:hypothetical protein
MMMLRGRSLYLRLSNGRKRYWGRYMVNLMDESGRTWNDG